MEKDENIDNKDQNSENTNFVSNEQKKDEEIKQDESKKNEKKKKYFSRGKNKRTRR